MMAMLTVAATVGPAFYLAATIFMVAAVVAGLYILGAVLGIFARPVPRPPRHRTTLDPDFPNSRTVPRTRDGVD